MYVEHDTIYIVFNMQKKNTQLHNSGSWIHISKYKSCLGSINTKLRGVLASVSYFAQTATAKCHKGWIKQQEVLKVLEAGRFWLEGTFFLIQLATSAVSSHGKGRALEPLPLL